MKQNHLYRLWMNLTKIQHQAKNNTAEKYAQHAIKDTQDPCYMVL